MNNPLRIAIGRALAEVSGMPLMALTFDQHLAVIKEIIKNNK